MAWPASTQTIVDAFQETNKKALGMKTRVQAVRDNSAAGPIDRNILLNLQRDLDTAIDLWNTAKAITGIVQYAKDQFADQALDVAAEFNGMVNAAITLRDWIFNNFPTDAGTGAVLVHTVDIEGAVTHLTFSSAQLATFRTHADTFTATIG